MPEKRIYRLVHGEARRRAAQDCQNAPDGWIVTVAEATRTLEQNAAQWPILEAFAQQIDWPINGVMQKITPDDWKNILTAAFRQEAARIAPGLNGGMVLLGHRTSKFDKREFSDWLEFLHSVAVDRGVVVYEVSG